MKYSCNRNWGSQTVAVAQCYDMSMISSLFTPSFDPYTFARNSSLRLSLIYVAELLIIEVICHWCYRSMKN